MTFPRLIFALLIAFTNLAYSQGTINVPVNECLGNLTNFTYTPPSGLTLSSANWTFGDGFSSGNNSPSHTYSQIGTYKIIIQATFTNSSTRTDSATINVVGLPHAGFIQMKIRDTCLTRNKICYIDTSGPYNSSQKITQTMFVWGDGTYTQISNPKKGDTLCHTYAVADVYTLKLEVTDTFGCKDSKNTGVTILDNIEPYYTFDEDGFVDCNTFQICLKNRSTGSIFPTSTFRWVINNVLVDTNRNLNSRNCFNFTKTQMQNIYLVAFNNNACRDSFKRSFPVVVDSLPTVMELSDTLKCFGENSNSYAEVRNVNRDYSRWFINGAIQGIPPIETHYLFYNTRLLPTHQTIKYRIYRGNCFHDVDRTFKIIGPVAGIEAFDNIQCRSNRTAYYVNKSSFYDSAHVKFHWYIDDSNGDSCINYRAKGINLYKNCLESLDWYTKFKYKKGTGLGSASLVITDTVTGCKDSAFVLTDMMECPKILDKDTFVVCQGSTMLEEYPLPAPKFFTVDSGKTWLKFPKVMDSTYSGYYEIGFIFENIVPKWAKDTLNDSIKIRTDTLYFYDTIFNKQILHVPAPRRGKIDIKLSSLCSPFKVVVNFDSSKFYNKEKLLVVWGDAGNVDIEFKKDTIIDSVYHYYRMGGVSTEIQVFVTNEYGCVNRLKYPFEIGKAISYYTPKFINCKNDLVCFTPGVFDFKERKYWSGNTPNNKVNWLFPDTPGLITDFYPCVRYKSGGLRPFRMIVTDSFGCRDTLRDTVFIQDVKANFKKTGTFIYCSELKQFFDSSSYLNNPKWRVLFPVDYRDSIKKYAWQFGNGTFSSLTKNPLQTLNTSLDKIPAAHMVETVSGCTDTIYFEIDVIGPKPFFLIRDTLGCGKLDAEFVNLSRDCKQYIWQFGDSANTTSQTSSKNNVNFTYNKPGRYFISLVGIDTVYNPFTQKMEYCFNTFPDKNFQKDTTRSVLVLPKLKTGITGPDTICPNTPFVLKSLSDTGYSGDLWTLSDPSLLDTAAGLQWLRSFQKGGTYTIKLEPYYNDALKNTCRDTAIKTIYVMDINADFVIDPVSKAPQFYFTNKSSPTNADFTWNYGQNGLAESHDFNGSVNYGNDSGLYNICLTAEIPYGCIDSVCKPVFSDYISGFMLYNVFTPGNNDAKNDEFDVQIEGESSYHLQIFDQWGVLVFESTKDADVNSGGNWDGTYLNQGKDCPAATYYYIFDYELRSEPGKKFTYQGTVTLIR